MNSNKCVNGYDLNANETELEVSKKCEKSVRDEAARYFHGPKKDVASMYYTLACSHRYVVRPAVIMVICDNSKNNNWVVNTLQTISNKFGLMTIFHSFKNTDECISNLNTYNYDLIFVLQDQLLGNDGQKFILNLQYLVSSTPVIVIGEESKYSQLMSMCDFTAFLRLPFSFTDYLHYLLRYVYEVHELKIKNKELRRIVKQERLRFQIMEAIRLYPQEVPIVKMGIPVAIALREKLGIDRYLEKNKFNIPPSYQIPFATQTFRPKRDDFSNPLTATLPEEWPVFYEEEYEYSTASEDETILEGENDPEMSQLTSEGKKPRKKRVSVGKRAVSERVKQFVFENADAYSSDVTEEYSALSRNHENQPVEHRYVPIAPKM